MCDLEHFPLKIIYVASKGKCVLYYYLFIYLLQLHKRDRSYLNLGEIAFKYLKRVQNPVMMLCGVSYVLIIAHGYFNLS